MISRTEYVVAMCMIVATVSFTIAAIFFIALTSI